MKEFTLAFRYDVELFQRIEHLIGKKLPLHPTIEEEVMSLVERVSEAQRCAKMVSCKRFEVVKAIYILLTIGIKRSDGQKKTSSRNRRFTSCQKNST